LNPCIEQIDGVIVKLAAIGNLAFEFCRPLLQLQEGRIGLQRRIGFCYGKEFAHGTAQAAAGLRLLTDGGRSAVAGSRFDETLQCFPLVFHVSSANINQLGQFVVPLF